MATPEPYKDSYLDDVRPPTGFFSGFRVGNFPTLYPSIKTSESSDILIAGLIFAAVILVFSLLLIIPGVRRWQVSVQRSSVLSKQTRSSAVAKRPCDCSVDQFWQNVTGRQYFADIIGLSSTNVM